MADVVADGTEGAEVHAMAQRFTEVELKPTPLRGKRKEKGLATLLAPEPGPAAPLNGVEAEEEVKGNWPVVAVNPCTVPEKFLSKNGRSGDDALFELMLADPVENGNKEKLCEPAEEGLNEPKDNEEKPNGAEKEEHPNAFATPPPTDTEAAVHGIKKTLAGLLENPGTGAAVKLAESTDVSLSFVTSVDSVREEISGAAGTCVDLTVVSCWCKNGLSRESND